MSNRTDPRICDVCDSTCDTCFNACPNSCLTCTLSKQMEISTCFLVCSTGKFINLNKVCSPCGQNCEICSSLALCQNCSTGFWLFPGNSSCVSSCPQGYTASESGAQCLMTPRPACSDGFFLEFPSKDCIRCSDSKCKVCTSANECKTCYSPFLLMQNKCLSYSCQQLVCASDVQDHAQHVRLTHLVGSRNAQVVLLVPFLSI